MSQDQKPCSDLSLEDVIRLLVQSKADLMLDIGLNNVRIVEDGIVKYYSMVRKEGRIYYHCYFEHELKNYYDTRWD